MAAQARPLQLRPLQAMERLAIGSNGGMLVEAVSDPAQAAGIQAGDILLSINGKPVTSIDQLRHATRNIKGPIALLISRGGERLFVALGLAGLPR